MVTDNKANKVHTCAPTVFFSQGDSVTMKEKIPSKKILVPWFELYF